MPETPIEKLRALVAEMREEAGLDSSDLRAANARARWERGEEITRIGEDDPAWGDFLHDHPELTDA